MSRVLVPGRRPRSHNSADSRSIPWFVNRSARAFVHRRNRIPQPEHLGRREYSVARM